MNGIAIRRFFCISQRCDFLKSCPKQKGPWNTIEGGIGGFHSLPMSQRTMGSIVLSLHGQWLPYFNWASSLIEYRDCSSSGLIRLLSLACTFLYLLCWRSKWEGIWVLVIWITWQCQYVCPSWYTFFKKSIDISIIFKLFISSFEGAWAN